MKLVDKNLLYAILALIIFGLIMGFSASYSKYGVNIIIKQVIFLGVGIIFSSVFFIKHHLFGINSDFLMKYSNWIWGITCVLLLAVFIPIEGNEANGSIRWINLQYFKFQPSEMAKLVIVIITARLIINQEIRTYFGSIKTLWLVVPFAALLAFETDFGAIMLITITAFIMIFIAGTRLRHWVFIVMLCFIFLLLLVASTDNRFDRILAFLNSSGDMDTQRLQAAIGIVRGGWFGVGIGGSLQKISKLPEAHNDMIFAIIGEETGVFGMLVLLSLFTYVFYKGFLIAQSAIKKQRPFQSYLAFGIAFILSMQTLLNLSVNLSIVPPTGVTLPLISYGGSSMVFTIIMLAILLKIDIENKQQKI